MDEEYELRRVRGRQANHAYVTTVGDGDLHTAFTPETLRPPTAVEILETVLARDGATRSVTTELAHADQPTQQLADAVNRYRDALTVALEHHHAPALEHLDRDADHVVPGLTDCNAWPTLRQRLLAAADTTTPLEELRRVATGHRFDDIRDPAALLASLVPEPTGGPLPWLPHIPAVLADDDRWGPYLDARATRVDTLTHQIRSQTLQAPAPDWMPIKEHVPAKLIGDVAVWRAAMGVEPADRRPTGERVFAGAARDHQDQLDRQLLATVPTLGINQLRTLGQGLEHDPATPTLARHLARLEARNLPVAILVANALTQGPLPAERPAAALQWRIQALKQQRPPAAADEGSRWQAWADTIDPELTSSPQWPTIRGLLTNLPETTDTESMKNHLQGRSPREVRAALMRMRAAQRSNAHAPTKARQQRQQALIRKPPSGIQR